MSQTSAKNKEGLINKISSNLLLEIQTYIPFNIILNIFRHSKKYQEYLNVNLSIYKKCFIKNKIKFDFNIMSLNNILVFFQKELHKFTSAEDKAFFMKIIIEEFKNRNKIKENLSYIPPLIKKKIQYEENIIWKEDKDINYLILGYEYICHHGHKFHITDESEQKIIPSQCFPNIKVISTDNNFIIPASMMKNLMALDIRPFSRKKVLFYNDTGEKEIELNNLESFVISRNRINSSPLMKKPKNKDVNYDIKFRFKKLEELKICLDLDRELTFLNKYFGIDFLESIDDIKNNKVLLFENMKNKIFNYELLDTINQFDLTLRFNGSIDIAFDLEFKIIRYANNIKRYTFKILEIYDRVTHEEIYEENNKKEKNLIEYIDNNIIKYNDGFFSTLCTLNDLKVILPNDEMIKNKFIEFFNINENNYSLRSLFLKLNNNINIYELLKNIAKFRVLESLVVKDAIKNKEELLNLVEDISKIHTIRILNLYFLGKLSSQEKANINQYSQNILFIDINEEKEDNIDKNKLIIFEIY